MERQSWILLARAASAAGLALFATVTVLVPPESALSGFFNVWVYNGLLVLACLVVASHAFLVAEERRVWAVVAAAIACWIFGEVVLVVWQPEAFPSVADAGFLAFYPLLYVGIVLLLRRARGIAGTLWLDGATAAVASAALGAAVLVEVVLRTTEGPLAAVATNLAYPLGDVLLLALVAGVFSLSGWRPGRRWLLLGLGLVAAAIADGVYLVQAAAGTYVEGTWVDILWPASLLLVAASAWTEDRTRHGLDVAGRPLLAVPAGGALVATGILVYDHFHRVNLLSLALASVTLLLVTARLAVTFRENGRLLAQTRHEAVTDALTGLGNRRKLVDDLSRLLDGEAPDPALLALFDLDGFKGYNDTFGHPAGDALLARLGGKLADVAGTSAAAYRLGGDEFCLLAPVAGHDIERLLHRASEALSEQGEGFRVGSSFGAVLLPEEAADPSRALQVADERLYSQKRSRQADERTVQALLDTLSAVDPDLEDHLQGVSSLARAVARSLGLRGDELDELVRAARLHDLGKVAVPDEILRKPGPLDEREWAFVRQHTLVGERILRASPALHGVASIVRSTHERWDGAGYPDGLAGEEIPLASRIICACDAYDAMISERTYRPARPPQEALAELERCAGTQFDPTVVRVLVAHVRDALAAEQAA
jgi:two-component system cell cycle response regulator